MVAGYFPAPGSGHRPPHAVGQAEVLPSRPSRQSGAQSAHASGHVRSALLMVFIRSTPQGYCLLLGMHIAAYVM